MPVPDHQTNIVGMPAPLHLEAAGVSFPMVVAGEGPPILFVHGAWADLRIWCGFWKQISERHKFLAITQRHFGREVWPSTRPFSRAVHTNDLIAVLRAMNTSVHLVGWSYAGAILLRTACEVPELVRSLVIFEPSFESEAPPKDNEKLLRAREVFWRELEPAYAVAGSGDLHLAMRLGIEIVFGLGRGGFEALDPRVQGVFLDNAHTMIPDLKAPAAEPLTKAELGMVTCPTLICCGERTHAQYQLMAESTLSGLANGSIRRFAGFGHGVPVQAPNHFAEVVLDFVDAVLV